MPEDAGYKLDQYRRGRKRRRALAKLAPSRGKSPAQPRDTPPSRQERKSIETEDKRRRVAVGRPSASGLTTSERRGYEERHARRPVKLDLLPGKHELGVTVLPSGTHAKIARGMVKQTKEYAHAAGPAGVLVAHSTLKDVTRGGLKPRKGPLTKLLTGDDVDKDDWRNLIDKTPNLRKNVVEPAADDLKRLATPGPIILRYDKGGAPVYLGKNRLETHDKAQAETSMLEELVRRPLDVALIGRGTVMSLGKGAVKAGLASDARLPVTLRMKPSADHPKGLKVVTKHSSPNPVRRAEQQSIRRATTGVTGAIERGVEKASDVRVRGRALPLAGRVSGRDVRLPIVGEHARAVKAHQKRQRRQQSTEIERAMKPFAEALRPVGPRHRAALVLAEQGIKPSELRAWYDEGANRTSDRLNAATDRQGRDPKDVYREAKDAGMPRDQLKNLLRELNMERRDEGSVSRAHENQLRFYQDFIGHLDRNKIDDAAVAEVMADPKFKPARAAAKQLTKMTGDLMEAEGLLTPETRLLRPYLAVRLMGGAKFEPEKVQPPGRAGWKESGRAEKPGVRAGSRLVTQIDAIEEELPRLQARVDKERGRRRARNEHEAKVRVAELEERLSDTFELYIARQFKLDRGDNGLTRKQIASVFGDQKEQARRNIVNGILRAYRRGERRKGVARTLRETGGKEYPTVAVEQMGQLADEFFAMLKGHPSGTRVVDELDRLEGNLKQLAERKRPASASVGEEAEFDALFGKPKAEPQPESRVSAITPKIAPEMEERIAALEAKVREQIGADPQEPWSDSFLRWPEEEGGGFVSDEARMLAAAIERFDRLPRPKAEPAPLASGKVPELHPDQMDVDAVLQRQERAANMPRPVSDADKRALLGEVPYEAPELHRLTAGLSVLKDLHQRKLREFGRRKNPVATSLTPSLKPTGRVELQGGPAVEGLIDSLPNLLHFSHQGQRLPEGKVPLAHSGAVPPTRPGMTKLNQGIRFETARWLPDPGVWSDSFVNAIAYTHAKVRGAFAWSIARELNADGRTSPGWVYVRQQKAPPKRAEREGQPLAQEMEEFTAGKSGMLDWLEQNVVSDSAVRAADWSKQGYLVRQIPKSDHREIFGEFKPASSAAIRILDKSTDFWRQLTLTYRPAWLVNNFVGQTLLFAMHHGSPDGVAAYAQAVLDERKAAKGTKKPLLWERRGTARPVPEELGHSGFIRSEVQGGYEISPSRPLTPAWEQNLREGIQRFNAHLSDNIPRRAAFYRVAEKERKLLNKIHGTTKTLDEFLEELKVARAPGGNRRTRALSDRMTQQVLDELVDFRNLTQFERSTVRRVVPFYSWIKGITMVSARYMADSPLRAELIAQMGELGQSLEEREFGAGRDVLHGQYPLSGENEQGERTMLSTVGLNPGATFSDVIRMGTGSVSKDAATADNPFFMANPFLQSLVAGVAREDLFTRKAIDVPGGQVGAVASEMVGSFPEVQVARDVLAPQGKFKKGGKPRITVPGTKIAGIPTTLLRFAGASVSRKNVGAAAELAEKERRERMSPIERARYDVDSKKEEGLQLLRKEFGADEWKQYGPEQEAAWRWYYLRRAGRVQMRAKHPSEPKYLIGLRADLEYLVSANQLSRQAADGWVEWGKSDSTTSEVVSKKLQQWGRDYFSRGTLTELENALQSRGHDWKIPPITAPN